MSMHDQRYLRRTSLGGPRRASEITPREKLIPRDEHINEATYGQSGRVENPSRRYIPGAKKWYSGYNVKGQEDPLAEDFPVGVRRRRARCLIFFAVLSGILAIVTTVLVALVIYNLDMDKRGLRGAVVEPTAVGFLKPVRVFGDALLQGTKTVVRGFDGKALMLAAETIVLTALSSSGRRSSQMRMDNDSIIFSGARLRVHEDDAAPPLMALDPDVTTINAGRTEIDGILIVENDTDVFVTRIVPELGSSLEVASTEDLNALAFADILGDARLGKTQLLSPNGDLVVNASSGNFGLGMTMQAGAAIRLSSGVRLPPLSPGAAWTLCACGSDGGLYAVPGTTGCDDPVAAASDPTRCP